MKWHDFDSSFYARSLYYEAMGLGPASSFTGSAAQNQKILAWMKTHGFKHGLRKSSKNQWAMTQEDGMEIISRPGLGMLTPIAKDDTVFTADQTKALWALSKSYVNQAVPKYEQIGSSVGSINNNINVQIANVSNYDDFLRQMRDDQRFEKLIRACSLDVLNGANRVSKRRINI